MNISRPSTVYQTRRVTCKSVLVSTATRIEHWHTLPPDNIVEPNFVHALTGPFRGCLIAVVGYIYQIGWKRAVIGTWNRLNKLILASILLCKYVPVRLLILVWITLSIKYEYKNIFIYLSIYKAYEIYIEHYYYYYKIYYIFKWIYIKYLIIYYWNSYRTTVWEALIPRKKIWGQLWHMGTNGWL